MKIYRGTPDNSPLIRAGAFVSPMLERAAKYARYPDNGEGNELGYIFEMDVEEDEVEWEDRGDCIQGRLKNDVKAKKWTICDVRLHTLGRQSPVRIRLDGTCSWADGKDIEWKPITLGANVLPPSVRKNIL